MFDVLTALFIAAFLSATLLPGTSEAVLIGILANNGADPILAVGVASVGNTLGSCVNWVIGRFFERFRSAKWFPISANKFERYQLWYNKWGVWSLLASWVPIIGDPLTVFAGIARTPLWLFTLFVLVAKTARYSIITLGVLYAM